MPTMINGIGTTYYGRKNLYEENGLCEFCKFQGKLSSYETNLWFVIFLIPIIPLGRKQILRECPSCRRHRVLPLKKWQQMSREQVDRGIAEVREHPDDPAAAVKLHATLFDFGRRQEANALARLMETKFPQNAPALMQLGAAYDVQGMQEDAARLYKRALQADAEYPPARRAVAIDCIRRGELDHARELLRFMEQPGAQQEATPLFMLAGAYQRQKRREEALELYATIERLFPEFAKQKAFRKAYKECQRPSRVPARLRPYVLAGGALAALLIMALCINWYMAAHRTLYVVNGFDQPVEVQIDRDRAFTVEANAFKKQSLPEGTHLARTTLPGARREETTMRLTSGIVERWRGRVAFVLNPGGAAVLCVERAIYTVKGDQPNSETFFVGDRFLTLRNIDCAFEELPRTVELDSTGAHATRRRVSAIMEEPADLLVGLHSQQVPVDKLMDFAEAHLLSCPEETQLLWAYVGIGVTGGKQPRCEAFLRQGLSRRPVLIEWHRCHQQLALKSGGKEEVAREYDALIQASPGDSALLYLRGRVAPFAEAAGFYDRAIAADPKNPYPRHAKAYRFMVEARFAEARPLCAEAVDLDSAHGQFQELWFDLRLALGEYDALAQERSQRIARDPGDLSSCIGLMQVEAARSGAAGVEKTRPQWRAAVRKLDPNGSGKLTQWVEYLSAYMSNDMPGVQTAAAALGAPYLRFTAALETGDLEGAGKALQSFDDKAEAGDSALLLWLAWRCRGEPAKAAPFLEQSRAALAAAADDPVLTALLSGESKDPLADALEMDALPDMRRTIYAVLAELYPAQREKLVRMAEAFNFSPMPPHRFLAQTLADMKNSGGGQ